MILEFDDNTEGIIGMDEIINYCIQIHERIRLKHHNIKCNLTPERMTLYLLTSQGEYYAKNGAKLFNEDFFIEDGKIIARPVEARFKNIEVLDSRDEKVKIVPTSRKMTEAQQSLVVEVLNDYEDYDIEDLRSLYYNSPMFVKGEISGVIKKADILAHFQSKYREAFNEGMNVDFANVEF